MDYLAKQNLIKPETRVSLLRNRLVLIAPADSKSALKIGPGFPLASAIGKERLAMADPASVPAGRYGRAALEALGVWKDVEARVAGASDVRAALVLVARGEAPFGIVYSTDAAVEPKVRVVDLFPEGTHPPIIYPAAVIATSRSGAATAFLRSLSQPAARATFEKYGFK
jgi:molybdate transport system substrate-binding protein